MLLKRIELSGFKSFADRIEMSFESGVTGIIGPNGCGKSNISDAVRWVLGEQSPKQLRGASMSDVIFNGTEKRRPQQFCEVSLVFDNAERILHPEYDQVCVTRRVYRSGEGEYSINKHPCRLKDIVDMFRDTGIGKEGYSLIGQGRIDEILSLRSDDRRAVFEEAAGIVKYKARRTEAEKKLAAAADNLSRVDDIIGELERSLAPLRAQAETARRYLRLSDRLRELELGAFAAQYDIYISKIDKLTAQISELDAQCEQDTQLEGNYEDEVHRREQDADALEGALSVRREDMLGLTRQLEAARGEIQLHTQRKAALEAERASLTAQRAEAEARLAQLLTADNDALAAEKQAALDAMGAELAALETETNSAQAALDVREEELEAKKSQLITALNRISDMKAARSRLNAMRESVSARLLQLGAQDEQRGGERAQLEAALAEARRNSDAAAKELAQLSALLTEAQRTQAAKRDELTQAFAAQERLGGASRELASRLKLLEQMQRDYEGYNFSVKEVLRKAAADGDAGIVGIVADILRVPADVEKAVETVLGGQLQNIVCRDEFDAKRMIEYLRAGRLGRATFLPVTTVSGRTLSVQERGALGMPGCIGLASELVSFDPRYRGIVEYLLGRTLVADNMDSGIAIMRRYRNAFRLVTLDGDVMNPSGAMTGGSSQSRASGILSRQRQIDEERASMEKLRARTQTAAVAIERLQAEREALRVEISELTGRCHQQDIACARDAERLTGASERLARFNAETEALATEAGQLTASLHDIEESLARTQTDADSERQAGDDRQGDIDALSAEVFSMRRALEKLRERRAARELAMSQADGELRVLMRDGQHIERERERLGGALKAADERLARIAADMEAAQAALDSATGAEAAVQRALSDEQAQTALLEGDRLRCQQAARSASDSLTRLRAEMRERTERRHRAELQLAKQQSELRSASDRIWEDYQLTYAGAAEYLPDGFDLAAALAEIASSRREIRAMGSVNVGAIDESRAASERYEQLSSQRADLTGAIDDLQRIIGELNSKMRTQFAEQFRLINDNFGQTFARLFGGGMAQLKLSDPTDPLGSGIDIIAQPPGKKLQLMSLLSGGERALTAIAILFAILMLKPTPFCILDEIDAALDEANVDNFADFLRTFMGSTQFVVVTHRKGTMERCSGLYGVSMEEKGVSKIVSVRLDDA